MKIRLDFVTNSSSSSFILGKYNENIWNKENTFKINIVDIREQGILEQLLKDEDFRDVIYWYDDIYNNYYTKDRYDFGRIVIFGGLCGNIPQILVNKISSLAEYACDNMG